MTAAPTQPSTLTLAIDDYDHTRDLVSGAVAVDGASIEAVRLPVSEIFSRFARTREWDIAELSLGLLANLISRDQTWLTALPVFTSRVFRQSAIFVRRDGRIANPADLNGATIGFPDWTHTAGIYVRGWLQHQHRVDLTSVRWVQAGVNRPGLAAHGGLNLPDGITHETVSDRSLNAMLAAGDIDAVISAHEPAAVAQPDGPVVRLEPANIEFERAYYAATGIFPIMHVIAVKTEALAARPELAQGLLAAFEQAKQNSLARMADTLVSRFPNPWTGLNLAETKSVFGADPWPYGLSRNEATLSRFLAFAHEQGITHRRLRVDELFAVREKGH